MPLRLTRTVPLPLIELCDGAAICGDAQLDLKRVTGIGRSLHGLGNFSKRICGAARLVCRRNCARFAFCGLRLRWIPVYVLRSFHRFRSRLSWPGGAALVCHPRRHFKPYLHSDSRVTQRHCDVTTKSHRTSTWLPTNRISVSTTLSKTGPRASALGCEQRGGIGFATGCENKTLYSRTWRTGWRRPSRTLAMSLLPRRQLFRNLSFN
jgi:hypothetical protein